MSKAVTRTRIVPRGTKQSWVQQEVAAAIGRGEIRPFFGFLCGRCGVLLVDQQGNPRWDVVGRLTLVCLGGCPPAARRRKAALS